AQRETGLSGQKARDLLGGFLFSGSDVEKALDDISGGEQRRLSLAILVASGANVLILDEPTNHLDIESREALEDALSAFEGAVILVSHDRALLDAVGSRTIVCEDGELRSHPSGWAAYQRRREEDEEAVSAAAAATKRSAKGGKRQSPRTIAQRAVRKASRLAEKVEAAEAELRAVEEELADPAAWSTPARSERANERHDAAKRKVAELYEQWEEAERTVSAAGDPA
ncbi:MAG TPA: ATP-binding cassette domain-containing protein, partial [Solirubrobacterales bacterium]|nr:ATP-binding cassette domain-containing protein [Solirubrobacterales bacterium]